MPPNGGIQLFVQGSFRQGKQLPGIAVKVLLHRIQIALGQVFPGLFQKLNGKIQQITMLPVLLEGVSGLC